jgi:polysaccharide biosynthesis transport protein
MEFESDNAELSAYVLNSISNTFIGYYTYVVTQNKKQSVQYLDSMLKQKQAVLLAGLDALNQYKIKNNIVDIEEQTRTLYSQMADVAARKGMAQKEAIGYSAALSTVNRKFQGGGGGVLETKLSGLNQEIVQTKEELQNLNDAYIKSDFDPKYKAKMDSAQRRLQAQIIKQSELSAYDPASSRENLATQKLNLELSNAMATNTLGTYDEELNRLNAGLSKIAPDAANLESLKNAVDMAEKEYQEILQKYNEAVMTASFTLPLKQIERAVPPDPEPNMKMVIVALSGVLSLVFSILVLFVMFYFDRSVYTVSQLELVTDATVLGSLNVMKLGTTDLKQLWNPHNNDPNGQVFKNLMRAVRYEIENDLHANELQTSKVIAVTSFSGRAGKTFFTKSLAFALTKINKRVLIIDGNFMNPDLSNNTNGAQFLETYLLGSGDQVSDSTAIAVIGNKGGDNSILELTDPDTVHKMMDQLKDMYDVIIIETNALETINKAKAKEWMMFTDKVIAVVEAGHPFSNEMHHELKYLKGMGSKFAGLVLNKVPGMNTEAEREARKSFFAKMKAKAKFKTKENKFKAA